MVQQKGGENIDLFNLFAKISIDTSDYEDGVKRATSDGDGLIDQLRNELPNAANNAGDSMNDASDAASNMSGGFSVAKGVIADLISSGVQRLVGAFTNLVSSIWNLDSATEEYRQAMGRLNTAYDAAGYGADTAQEAYTEFYKILGDTDTATEASQLLAQLADNAEDVSVWTNIAAGVNGTFGDSLPIEGLIEASNETAKVGQVTGVLADALNWVGISEDAFNEKLAACTDESERNNLIMETLSGTYSDAADAFYENNDALVASRESQAQMDNSLARLGDSISRVKNAFMQQFAPAIDTAINKVADFISGIDPSEVVSKAQQLINVFKALAPVLTAAAAAAVAYKAAMAISSVIDAVKNATTGLSVAQAALNAVMNANPFVLVATLIAALVAGIITLWNTNDQFRAAVEPIWEAIKGVFTSAWESIKAVWDTVQPYFAAIWEGIKAVFSVVADVLGGYFSLAWNAIKAVWDVVTSYFQAIFDTITGIFSAVKAVLSGDFSAAWEAIKGVFSSWGDYFTGLWDTVKNIFSNAWETFKDIGANIVNGIKNGISEKWEAFKGWVGDKVSGLVGFAKDLLGISSPSKVFAGIGENMVAGMEKGWGDEFPALQRQIENGMNFGTASVGFASSGLGVSSAGIINGINASAARDGGSYSFNLIMPDGKKLATYTFQPMVDYAKANGTPILKPT